MMDNKPIGRKQTIVITVLLFLSMTLLGPHVGAQYDITYWIAWADQIYVKGFSEAYAMPGNDYMPLIQYVLYVYTIFQDSLIAIQENIGYLKALGIAFDILGLWYVYRFIDKKVAFVGILMLNMLNPAFFYNSFLWEQFDGVLSTLNLIAVYYAWKRKMILSVIFYTISFNMKIQAIVLLPVIGYFYLENLLEQRSVKAFLLPLVVIAAVQFAFLVPFMNSSLGVSAIWKVVFSSVGRYPMVSLNACNFWDVILERGVIDVTSDDNVFIGGMSYRTIGLILFMLVSLASLLPLLRILVLKARNKVAKPVTLPVLLLICALLYLSFYFFNTQMHERYAHPAMIFFIAYGFLRRRYLLYAIFSVSYFLTLERLFLWLRLKNYDTVIFNPTFIAYLYLIIIVYAFYLLYRKEVGFIGTDVIKEEAVTM